MTIGITNGFGIGALRFFTIKDINTYEKVLFNNPDDRESEQRLAELKAPIEVETEPVSSEEDVVRAKTGKTIAVLDDWLTRIRAKNNG